MILIVRELTKVEKKDQGGQSPPVCRASYPIILKDAPVRFHSILVALQF